MRPDFAQEAKWWLAQAESDFSALRILHSARKFDIVCFLSQQVAEKALKAYLIWKEEEQVTSHSVSRLTEIAGKYDSEFLALRSEVKRLTPYYVEARYPNALEEIPAHYFDERDANEAIQMAGKTLEFVKRKFIQGNVILGGLE